MERLEKEQGCMLVIAGGVILGIIGLMLIPVAIWAVIMVILGCLNVLAYPFWLVAKLGGQIGLWKKVDD